MSEYQFYEFQSVDRPLTTKEQQEIDKWSSRTSPSSTGATFIYNYSDFSKDPKQVVRKYFDAMFYIANWGTKQLMFRFPKELIDRETIQAYCTVDEISLYEYEKCFVLDMLFSEEESYHDWVDGEGSLSSLIGLRQDILQGDYRSLYLAWLHACWFSREWDEFDQNMPEPPISRPLKPFNGALKSWVELLEIEQSILTVASKTKTRIAKEQSKDVSTLIPLLAETEKDDFLLRLVNEEALLSVKLRKRLQKMLKPSGKHTVSGRTIGEIFQEVEQIEQQLLKATQQKRERAENKLLKELEAKEATLWKNVSQHISEKKPKEYDAAIVILKDLLLLAKHRGTQLEYEQRIRGILTEYPRLSSLKTKITKAKLLSKIG